MCAEKRHQCDPNNLVYKDSEHVKHNNVNLGSIAEFCAAFYHVPKKGSGCLDPRNCHIGKQGISAEPKSAVALVKFQLKNDKHFLRRYTNCYTKKEHAEEHFIKDAVVNICSFDQLEAVTMYITMQPCHKSVSDTQGTKEGWSCCKALIDLAAGQLKGVKIVIKPTHLSQAGWKITPEWETQIRNAEKGIKKLMHCNNITLTKMEPSDWTFLWDFVEKPEEFENEKQKEERRKLDDEIGVKLQQWQRMKKQQTEVVTKDMGQLRIGKQLKSKK